MPSGRGGALAAPLLTGGADGFSRPASPQPVDVELAEAETIEVTIELPAASEPPPAHDGTEQPDPWHGLGVRWRFPFIDAVAPDSPAAAARPELTAGMSLAAVRRHGDGSWAEGVAELSEAEALALLGLDGVQPPRQLVLRFATGDGGFALLQRLTGVGGDGFTVPSAAPPRPAEGGGGAAERESLTPVGRFVWSLPPVAGLLGLGIGPHDTDQMLLPRRDAGVLPAPRAMPVSAPASDTWPRGTAARGTVARARRRAWRGGSEGDGRRRPGPCTAAPCLRRDLQSKRSFSARAGALTRMTS